MTKFFIKWWVDNLETPNTPEETGQLFFSMLEPVKADLSAGKLIDWCSLPTDGKAMRLAS